jgi:hypothetical protein
MKLWQETSCSMGVAVDRSAIPEKLPQVVHIGH